MKPDGVPAEFLRLGRFLFVLNNQRATIDDALPFQMLQP
eukprot:SAG25_NODE_2885_length_1334_cov_1.418623_1_plen_38_part_10